MNYKTFECSFKYVSTLYDDPRCKITKDTCVEDELRPRICTILETHQMAAALCSEKGILKWVETEGLKRV